MNSSAERWSWVFLTLVVLVCIWLLFRRAQLIITRAENTEDRADQILDRCDEFTEWLWEAHRQQPETQPMERVGTDTVETERVIDDEWLAAARKRWDEIAAEPVEKPTARTRTRKRASPPPPAPSPEPFHPTTLSQGPGQ